MVNVSLLKMKIDGSGLKMNYIADQLGMTPQGLYKKLNDASDWTFNQVMIIKRLLNLSDDEVNRIFLALTWNDNPQEEKEVNTMTDVRRTVTQKVDWMDLQVGDLISDNGIQFVVISREDDQAIIQQYDHIDDHVFNDNESNVYKGSDLEKYVQGVYRDQFSERFLQRCGDFFILPVEMYGENEFLKNPTNRIRYDSKGYATWYWTSSPHVGSGGSVRIR